ncbi:MAG: hypothetical protein D6731_08750 [Planctomycetota bacterium]|nr:MAG: hypothetical protein D6731_08750 [Planctomycetota bacterium]
MHRTHTWWYLTPALLLVAGCASTEPFEEQIRTLTWRIDAAEQLAEQASVDKRLAEKEVELAQQRARVLKERLALAYDALREAQAKLDSGLQDRLTELSESTGGGGKLEISQYGGVVLESGVLFAPGRHELTAAGKRTLEPLIETLRGEKYDDYDIELAGHTDSDKIKHSRSRYRDNWDLASMRANSVRRFLIQRGIPAERLHLSSWGYTRPFESMADKAKNRRVEIMLRKRTQSLPASAPRDQDEKK